MLKGTSMHNYVKYLPTEKSNKKGIIATIIYILLYIFENSAVTSYIDGKIFSYIIKPILWIIITAILWQMPHIKSNSRIKHQKSINMWAKYFGFLYICIMVFAGFFDGLGKSPYSHTVQGVFINLIFVGSALVGREFIRNYLVSNFTKKESYLVLTIITLLMTITSFTINKYLELKSLESTVKFMAEYFIPEFSQNLFATYLVYLGGARTSIIYLGIIQGFHWFSPILPNLRWITTALVGILCPVFFLMYFKSLYLKLNKEQNKRQQDKEDILSWIITSIISICMIWFAIGVFPIYPSVIATGSMEPEIMPGDIILVEKITDIEDINNLNINDIIQFQRDGILISHRIIEIKNGEEGISFRTKGDNNSIADSDLVKPQDIKGTIKYTIPKIGWPTLLIKSNNKISLDDIVF